MLLYLCSVLGVLAWIPQSCLRCPRDITRASANLLRCNRQVVAIRFKWPCGRAEKIAGSREVFGLLPRRPDASSSRLRLVELVKQGSCRRRRHFEYVEKHIVWTCGKGAYPGAKRSQALAKMGLPLSK